MIIGKAAEMAARYFLQRRAYRRDARYYGGLLSTRRVRAEDAAGSADVLMLLPEIRKYAGGCTSALRIASALARRGRVVICATESGQSPARMRECAIFDVPDLVAEFIRPEDLAHWRFSTGIATFWTTAYLLEAMENVERKFYFVQDFEPAFYSNGDIRQMALNSYSKGLEIISLGAWNASQIAGLQGAATARLHTVDFPFEPGEYPVVKKTYELRERMKACVYIKMDPKRAPYLLQAFARRLRTRFAEAGRTLELAAYGLPARYQFEGLRNLGLLDKPGLRALYESSDFGMTVSLSNISLVNYEMAASGLPVLDACEGSAPAFFEDDEMLFFRLADLEKSVETIHGRLQDETAINALVEKCRNRIGGLSWAGTCEQFASITMPDKGA
jgi:hypothetical protein